MLNYKYKFITNLKYTNKTLRGLKCFKYDKKVEGTRKIFKKKKFEINLN